MFKCGNGMERAVDPEWWGDVLHKIQMKLNLTREESRQAFDAMWNAWEKMGALEGGILSKLPIIKGVRAWRLLKDVDPGIILASAGFTVGLNAKGATAEELLGVADVWTEHMFPDGKPRIRWKKPVVEVIGTGGDSINTINVSTSSAILAASAGANVLRGGSRQASGKSGSADFMDAMKIALTSEIDYVAKSVDEIGIGFRFEEPLVPSGDRIVKTALRLTLAPIFNSCLLLLRLGLMCTNFMNVNVLLRGLSHPCTEVVVEALSQHAGVDKVLAVYGTDDLNGTIDEFSNVGTSKVSELKGTKIETYYVTPQDFGVRRATPSEITVDSAIEGARIVTAIFENRRKGPHMDILLMNASSILYLAGIASDFLDGTEIAKNAIETGTALRKLEELRTYSVTWPRGVVS